jgi:hypothetical protein
MKLAGFQQQSTVDPSMNKSHPFRDSQDRHWEPKFPFDLVVAYEEQATRDRAMLLYDRMAQHLMDDYDFQCAWWKLDHLREPSLMEQAVDDAIQANMIIVSLASGSTVPKTALDWMKAWAPSKPGNKSALVALLGSGEQAGPPDSRQVCLQRIARQARMDFFLHCTDSGSHARLCTEEALHQRARTLTPFLEHLLHTPPPATLRV